MTSLLSTMQGYNNNNHYSCSIVTTVPNITPLIYRLKRNDIFSCFSLETRVNGDIIVSFYEQLIT